MIMLLLILLMPLFLPTGIPLLRTKYCFKKYFSFTIFFSPQTFLNSISLTINLLLQGAWGVISHHQNSVTQALLDLYPEIGLNKSSLLQPVLSMSHSLTFQKLSYFVLGFESVESRRQYFENFARTHNFDPLKLENWSDKIKESLLSLKVTQFLL